MSARLMNFIIYSEAPFYIILDESTMISNKTAEVQTVCFIKRKTSALIHHGCLCTVSGATAHPGHKCLRNQLQLILNLQPSVVFLHLRDNDLRARGSSHP